MDFMTNASHDFKMLMLVNRWARHLCECCPLCLLFAYLLRLTLEHIASEELSQRYIYREEIQQKTN